MGISKDKKCPNSQQMQTVPKDNWVYDHEVGETYDYYFVCDTCGRELRFPHEASGRLDFHETTIDFEVPVHQTNTKAEFNAAKKKGKQ